MYLLSSDTYKRLTKIADNQSNQLSNSNVNSVTYHGFSPPKSPSDSSENARQSRVQNQHLAEFRPVENGNQNILESDTIMEVDDPAPNINTESASETSTLPKKCSMKKTCCEGTPSSTQKCTPAVKQVKQQSSTTTQTQTSETRDSSIQTDSKPTKSRAEQTDILETRTVGTETPTDGPDSFTIPRQNHPQKVKKKNCRKTL